MDGFPIPPQGRREEGIDGFWTEVSLNHLPPRGLVGLVSRSVSSLWSFRLCENDPELSSRCVDKYKQHEAPGWVPFQRVRVDGSWRSVQKDQLELSCFACSLIAFR